MAVTKEQAMAAAEAFRAALVKEAGAGADDKRTCYELATQVHAMDTRQPHHRRLQGACQVIDELVAAMKDSLT